MGFIIRLTFRTGELCIRFAYIAAGDVTKPISIRGDIKMKHEQKKKQNKRKHYFRAIWSIKVVSRKKHAKIKEAVFVISEDSALHTRDRLARQQEIDQIKYCHHILRKQRETFLPQTRHATQCILDDPAHLPFLQSNTLLSQLLHVKTSNHQFR